MHVRWLAPLLLAAFVVMVLYAARPRQLTDVDIERIAQEAAEEALLNAGLQPTRQPPPGR